MPSWRTRAASSLRASSNRVGVEDRDVGVEQGDPEADPLDLGGDPLALLGLDDEVVVVLVLGDAGDGHAHRDRLRGLEVVVRLGLGDLGVGADAEGPQVADAGGGPDAEVIEPEPGVGGDPELRLDAVVVDLLDRRASRCPAGTRGSPGRRRAGCPERVSSTSVPRWPPGGRTALRTGEEADAAVAASSTRAAVIGERWMRMASPRGVQGSVGRSAVGGRSGGSGVVRCGAEGRSGQAVQRAPSASRISSIAAAASPGQQAEGQRQDGRWPAVPIRRGSTSRPGRRRHPSRR